MYEIRVNGRRFGSSPSGNSWNALIDPSVKVEVNKSGSFQCSILPNHEFYNQLIKMRSYVEIYQNNQLIFSGRLLHTETDSYGQMSCYFEGDLSYLIDTVQEPGIYEETIRERFIRILNVHNDQVEPEKQFYPGIIEIDEADDENAFQDTQYQDSHTVLESLVEKYGGYLVVRHFGGVTYLDYLKEYDKKSSQQLRFSKNIIDIQHYISGEDLFTVLLPLGKKEEEKKDDKEKESRAKKEETEEEESDIITIESVNNGSKFVEIEELVEVFGRIVKIQSFEGATTPEALLEMAHMFIEDSAPGLTDEITITALDLSFMDKSEKPIELGDVVEIFYEPLKIKKVMTCVSIDYDLNSPENTVYRFGVLKQDLSGKYASNVTIFENYESNNNRVIEYHNKIINQIEQDLIVNARDIEVNANNIDINAKNITMNADKIQMNADLIEMNAKDIIMNAERIAMLAEEITLYAKKDYVDEIEGRTVSLESYIKVLPGIIDMKASKTEVDELGEKYRTAQLEIDGINAEIRMKASAEDLTALEKRTTSAELNINGLLADINLKASATSVTELETRVNQAEVDIDGLNSQISLKADTTRVDGLSSSIGSVELRLDGLGQQILLKASQETVSDLGERVTTAESTIQSTTRSISLHTMQINDLTGDIDDVYLKLDAAENKITLKADKIDLLGYVTATQLNAKIADFEKAWSDRFDTITLSAQYVVAGKGDFDNLVCGELYVGSDTAVWKTQRVVTSVNSPLFNYVTLQYKDHSGTNKTQVVLTSVNTAASGNTTTLSYLGS